MFTINTQWALGKNGVMWDAEKSNIPKTPPNTADLIKLAKSKLDEASKYSDSIVAGHSVNDSLFSSKDSTVEGILKQVDKTNQGNKDRVMAFITEAKKSPEWTGAEKQKILTDMEARFEAEYTKLDTQRIVSTNATATDTKNATNKLSDAVAVIQLNSREKQGTDFGKYIESILTNSQKTEFQNLAYYQNGGTDGKGQGASRFIDVSVPNLIDHLLHGTVYIADGAYGPNEKYIVNQFTEFYTKNSSSLKPILEKLAPLYKSGQSLESKLDAPTSLTDKASIINYLAKTENKNTFGTDKFDEQMKKTIETALSGTQDDTEFLKIINNARRLTGATHDIVDTISLKGVLTTKPEVKYTIIAGIRTAARMSGGVASLRDTQKASGISENERNVLKQIDASKESLLVGLKDGFEKQLKEKIKTMDPSQKADAQKAVDAYIAELTKEGSSGWNIISKNLGAVVTNRGAGAMGGITADLPKNFLADNVSLGIGFSTGKPGVGVGITFDKAITPETKLLYGWAGTPFVGMTSQFDTWHLTGIAGVGGGLLNISKDMGNKDAEITRMEVMKQSEVLLKQIEALAKDPKKKVTDIKFNLDVSSLPKDSKNATEMTQSCAQALHNAINTEVQARLSVMGFDEAKNASPTVRSQMIYDALKGTIADRVDRLHLDDATGGWSLKSLGLTLGSFAGVPFLLPSASISRLQYTQRLHAEAGKVETRQAPIDTKTLFDLEKIRWEKYGNEYTYSIPLVADTKMTTENTTLPDGRGWHGSIPNGIPEKRIFGLKDYGIKVTLKDGKYTIAYDKANPVTASAEGTQAQETNFEGLERIETIEKALKNKDIRTTLSNLWLSPDRKAKANQFAQVLQTFQKGGEVTVEDAKNIFLDMAKGLAVLKPLRDLISKEKNPKKLQEALFDIRGGMMMDVNQANDFTKNKDGTSFINETPAKTKVRFDKMVDSPKMKTLLDAIGVSADQYKALLTGVGTKNDTLTIGGIEENTIGAVASLKTTDAYMALMPAGTMRFAKSGSNILKSDITGNEKIYNTLLPAGSMSEFALRKNIAKTLDPKSTTPIASVELKSLILEGKATIGGKEVKMNGQKFSLCAYGDCTNPALAFTPGKVSVDGKNGGVQITAESITTSEGASNVRLTSSVSVFGLTGAVGYVGNNPEDSKSTQGGKQDSQTGGDKTPATTPDQAPTGPHTNAPSTPVGPTPAPSPANTPSVNIDA